ncbi:helix-turn-helix transcriptional regulator [Enterococcus gilvus]|uniref:helix-turn-helix domain-containing protein n=1 Tax=Enterococcus gilvus TaxID=160453 RepID=UPI003D6ABD05
MTIGEKLQSKRKELDLTQGEVAEKLYVSRQAVSNWELGKNYPDLETIVAISELYQISLDILLKEDQHVVKGVKKTMNRKFLGMAFYLVTLLSMGICVLVNVLLDRTLTWSLIVVLSLVTADALVYFFGKRNRWHPYLLMGGGSLLLLVFLGLLEVTLQQADYIQGSFFVGIALPVSLLWLVLIWSVVLIQKRMKWSLYYSFSLFFLLGIVGGFLTNLFVHSEPLWFSTLTSTIPRVILSALFYVLGSCFDKTRSL